MPLRGLAAGVLAGVLILAVGTYVAGEQTEVAQLRTFDEAGAPHDTKLWVVDVGGVEWVRVARPERTWFARLQRDPHVEITRGGRTHPALARADRTPATRAAIDQAFRAKYGAVDWWYGLLLRRDPIPVRLDPAGPT